MRPSSKYCFIYHMRPSSEGGPGDEKEVNSKNYPQPVSAPQPKHQLL